SDLDGAYQHIARDAARACGSKCDRQNAKDIEMSSCGSSRSGECKHKRSSKIQDEYESAHCAHNRSIGCAGTRFGKLGALGDAQSVSASSLQPPALQPSHLPVFVRARAGNVCNVWRSGTRAIARSQCLRRSRCKFHMSLQRCAAARPRCPERPARSDARSHRAPLVQSRAAPRPSDPPGAPAARLVGDRLVHARPRRGSHSSHLPRGHPCTDGARGSAPEWWMIFPAPREVWGDWNAPRHPSVLPWMQQRNAETEAELYAACLTFGNDL